MNNNIKGIELVWLSKTDLTNLNSGEGGTNFVDVKKYRKNNIEYPYVSGQAMRHYLRDAMRRELVRYEYMCIPDDKGEGCGEPEKCINCDLFGYMKPKKKEGASVRVSPVKVSPAVGLLSFDDNSTIDFLTRKKTKDISETKGGDIVNVELGVNIYKCGISLDVQRIYAEEKYNENNCTVESFSSNGEIKKNRIDKLLNTICYITGYSKQSRLLTDFTPDIILGASQTKYSHRLQKAWEINGKSEVNLQRFEEIVKELKTYSTVYFGMVSAIVSNENELKAKAQELSLAIMTPLEVIKELIQTKN